jgi:GAF domain-containing protein
MSKPFIPEILLSKVKVFIELYSQRKRLQSLVDELNHANVKLTRRSMQLETSTKIGQQITSILNLKELLPQILTIIQSQFGFTYASIWLANDARDAITLEANTSYDEPVTVPMKHGGLVAKSCRGGEVVLENKASTNSIYVPTHGMKMVGAELALPLKLQNETLGVLDIQSERPQAFTPDDIAALEILTSQIVIAVRNAQLYAKAK